MGCLCTREGPSDGAVADLSTVDAFDLTACFPLDLELPTPRVIQRFEVSLKAAIFRERKLLLQEAARFEGPFAMIDHVSLAVRDLARSIAFYEKILEPLGLRQMVDDGARAGFGSRYPEVWLNARPGMTPVTADTGAHLCLRARTMDAVDVFHRRAIELGGGDDGAPGLRKATMVTYYAAFVRDLDGNRIEVMTVPAA